MSPLVVFVITLALSSQCQATEIEPENGFRVLPTFKAVARAEIIGFPDMHVDMGSTINLTCILTHTAKSPYLLMVIHWYHNKEKLDVLSPRGGIAMITKSGKTTTGYLLIQNAQPSDTGNYSCATFNTKSSALRLHVLNAAARAEIIGSPDMYVEMGSTINLTCIITNTTESPDNIHWYHNKEELDYYFPRGGIVMITESGKTTTGYLHIQNVQPMDTGSYSCATSNTKSSALRLHVLNGETPAAMQTNLTTCTSPVPLFPTIFLALLIWSLTSHPSLPLERGDVSGASCGPWGT